MVKQKVSSTVRGRIRDFFVENVGKVVSREQIQHAATDPRTGKIPENWHQRLSELRVDEGFDILSWRDRSWLKSGQYLLESATPKRVGKPRNYLSAKDKEKLFERDGYQCQWPDCTMVKGAIDPIGGGAVVLTADHKTPLSQANNDSTGTLDDWQTLCVLLLTQN